MPTPVTIGSTSYNVPLVGERNYGADTSALLVRLASVANQVVQSQIVLTTNYFLKDASGNYGVKANFVQGIGSTASADGFLRLASPYGEPGQGLSYPVGTPEGKSYTYISWRNSTNTGNIHLYPNNDNATLSFAGKTLANLDSTQTLSNKTLGSSNVIDGAAITDATITNAKIAAAAAITLSKLAAVTTNRALVSDGSGVISASSVTATELGYLAGVTGALVGTTTTQTLTNKTISAASNTITGLTKTDVGLGNVDNTSDASKPVSTATQTALDLKANLASPTFTGTVSGITKSMVGLGNVDNTSDATKNSATAVLTNKDIDGGTAANSRRITLPKDTYANLLLLTRKEGTIWYATDLDTVFYDDGSSLLPVGSNSGSGELNCIENPSAATAIAGWLGSATRDTSNSPLIPVVDTAISIANTAITEAPTSGGYYTITTLPTGLRSRRLKVEFFYTTPATDVYRVSVYRLTTKLSLTTDVSGVTTLPANSTGKFYAEFDATSSSDPYILSITRTSGSTGACVITNVIVGPGLQVQGPAVEKFKSYGTSAAGWNWTAGTGGSGIQYAYWRQVGNVMNVRAGLQIGSSGSSISGDISWTLPNGLTIDSSSADTRLANNDMFGAVHIVDAGVAHLATGVVVLGANNTQVKFLVGNAQVSATAPFTWAAQDGIWFEANIPITEWANGTVNLLNQQTQSPIKAGTIMPFAGATVPTGWLECDGSSYSQTLYPDLYATLGSTWATCTNPLTGSAYSAPTAGNFRVPDLRGAFLRGAGGPNAAGITTSLAGYQADSTAKNGLTNSSSTATITGTNSSSAVSNNFPITVSAPGNNNNLWHNTATTLAGGDGSNNGTFSVLGATFVATAQTWTQGSGTAAAQTITGDAETRPDNVGVKYIIKAWNESFNLAGFANASSNANGLVAPRKGQYSLTFSSTPAGWSLKRGVGLYYQDQDGNHRMKFNIIFAATAATSFSFVIDGVTFKNLGGSFQQAISAMCVGSAPYTGSAGCSSNSGTVNVYATSSSADIRISGDVELESKPSWA